MSKHGYYLYLDDYFGDVHDASNQDMEKIEWLRAKLSSFKNNEDAYEFLKEYRSNPENRANDELWFHIDDDKIPAIDDDKRNPRYKPNDYIDSSSPYPEYYKSKKDIDAGTNTAENPDNNNADIDNDYETPEIDKNGNIKKDYLDLIAGNNKAVKAIKFAIQNPQVVIWTSVGVLATILAIVLIIFSIGVSKSVGNSPFVLCGQGGSGSSVSSSSSGASSEMASKEVGMGMFIKKAKEAGWTNNAIIGAISYIMQEGQAMGTFTYEAYWCAKGPSGVYNDTTLDNQAWLKFVQSGANGQSQTQSSYNSSNWAIGIGLEQQTDHNVGGSWAAKNATAMIEAAIKDNKYWQDPDWQSSYLVNLVMSDRYSNDPDYVDPRKFTGSPEEYCRRYTAFVGMPGWSYTDNRKGIQDHVKHIKEAEEFCKNNAGITVGSLGVAGSGGQCSNSNSLVSIGNSTLADAAVSLCTYPQSDAESFPNTQNTSAALYKKIHDGVGSTAPYKDCGGFISMVCRWTGVDNDMPPVFVPTLRSHMESSSVWQKVSVTSEADLKPGDVLVYNDNHHIFMFVGNDALKKKYPDIPGDMNYVEASQDEYIATSIRHSAPDFSSVTVFRATSSQNNTQYKDLK